MEEHPSVTRFVSPEEEKKYREEAAAAASQEAELEQSPDIRLEICFPYMRYRLPMNDRQFLLYSKERSEQYTAALLREIEGSGAEFMDSLVSSIALRGGAGLEEPKVLGRILKQVRKEMNLADECEISLEANFGEIDMKRLRAYLLAGIHRFVIRAWSFCPSTCRRLGCLYDEALMEQLETACNTSRKAEICVTLYYDIPWESRSEFKRTLEFLGRLKLAQVAFLQFNPFAELSEEKKERQKKMETFLRGLMKEAGYEEYENLVFARRGKESLDLLMAKSGSEKIGFGMGAETILDGCHAANLTEFDQYLELAGDYRQLAKPAQPEGLFDLSGAASPEEIREALKKLASIVGMQDCQGDGSRDNKCQGD